jgi:hypothetical protein
VIGFHLLVDAIGLVILERQDVQFRAAQAVDDPLALETLPGLFLVEAECLVLKRINDEAAFLFFDDVVGRFFQYYTLDLVT